MKVTIALSFQNGDKSVAGRSTMFTHAVCTKKQTDNVLNKMNKNLIQDICHK